MNNIAELLEYYLTPAAQVGFIIAIAEIVKRLGLEKRFIPLVDVGLGLLIGIFIDGVLLGYGILYGVIIGLGIGLSACGLFSGVKNVFEKREDEEEEDEDDDEY